MSFSPRGRKGGGVNEWWLQRVSGGVLLLAVVFHFIYMHVVRTTNPRDLNFDSIAERLGQPEWVVFNLVLVTFSLLHAVIGLKISVDDFAKHRLARALGLTAVYVLAAALWGYGSFAIVKVGINAQGGHATAAAQDSGDTGDYNARNNALEDTGGPQAGDPPPQETPDWYPQGQEEGTK